jgi:hypothetical protein
MNCSAVVKKLYEISISISAPCWMSNGHIKVCKSCYGKEERDNIFFNSDKNYKKFGNIYCPATPVEWSRRDHMGVTTEGKECCTRACFDSRWCPMEGCKCMHCLNTAKWMKAKLVPKNWSPPIYSSRVETVNPYRKPGNAKVWSE